MTSRSASSHQALPLEPEPEPEPEPEIEEEETVGPDIPPPLTQASNEFGLRKRSLKKNKKAKRKSINIKKSKKSKKKLTRVKTYSKKHIKKIEKICKKFGINCDFLKSIN